MIENMQKFLKICNNTSKYAENMKKNFNFCFIYSFLEVLSHLLYFKPNLYFYVKYANIQNSGL